MDAIQPVGAMIQPPNPNQGLNAYSSLLGIQQQKQALQGQAAQVSQDQQRNAELQALQRFSMRAAQDPAYHNADGSLNTQKFQQDAMEQAPTYGAAYVGQMTANASGAVANRAALLRLSNEQRQTIGGYLGAVAANPNATRADLKRAISQARGVSDDKGYQSAIDDILMGMAPIGGLSDAEASQAIRQTARQGAMAVGAADVSASNPQMETYQAPKNILGLRQTNPQSPLGMGAMGGTVAGLAPSQQPGYLTQVAGSTAAASTMGAGASKIDVDTYNKALTAGAQSATVMDLSKRIEREAGEVRTGKFSQEFANRLTVFQQHNPGATATQMLQKDAANLKTMIEGGLVNPTDAERAAAGAGLPSPETMGPDALQKAARYWQGYAQMTGGRRDLALQHIQQTGSIAGYAAKDSQYMAKASPGALEPKKTATAAQLADYARRKGISVEAARAHAELHEVEIKQ